MNPLYLAIRAYQRFWLVNTAVRLAVRAHHLIRKPKTRPCPYAATGCSEHFAEQARMRGMSTLPLILSAMAVCGPATRQCGQEWGSSLTDCNEPRNISCPFGADRIGGPCGGPKGPPKSWEGDGC